MLVYVLRRLTHMVPLLLVISFLSFSIMEAAPGDYLTKLSSNQKISAETIRAQKVKYGFDKPFLERYFKWLRQLFFTNDASGQKRVFYLGESFEHSRPVTDLLYSRLLNTFLLALAATTLAWVVAVPLGILSAVKQYSWTDKLASSASFLGLSIPSILTALLLVYFASVSKHWDWYNALHLPQFPLGDMKSRDYEDLTLPYKILDLLHHLILPAIAAGIASIASYMRQMRASLKEVLNQDFVRTARAKGLTENTVIWRHAVRNAINPMITLFGYSLAGLLSGSFVVEVIMNWPGLATLVLGAITSQDVYLVMGSLMMSALLLIMGNLVADLLLAWADPRISLG